MKRLCSMILVFGLILGCSSTGWPALTEGLVAYWSFDEGSGNIAHDDSGNNHNGTIYGATWVDGVSGKALSFDGADDYVDIPGTGNLNPPTFTLSAWVKFSHYNKDNLVVGKHYSGRRGGYFLGVYYDKAAFWLSDEPRLHTSETYRDNQWHYLAGVYDGARQYLYVDGILAAQQAREYSWFTSVNIHIGAIVEGQYYGAFNGVIDEVSIYDRALSIEEIQQLYQLPWEETTPPIADAGGDIIADANELVTLDGSASYDPDGQIIKYTWKRLPDNVIIYSGPDPNCQTKSLGRVEEVIELTVTDNSFLATATDTVKIISRTIQDLQDQIDNIELTPGPQGPQGEPGIAPEEVEAMQSQIEGLQQQNQKLQTLLDKITSWPRIRHWLKSWERGRR